MNHLSLKNYADFESMSAAAARLVISRIQQRPEIRIGLSSGNTPTLTYKLIGNYLAKHSELIPRIDVVQLDEWVGLPPEDPSSCQNYLRISVSLPWQLAEDQCQFLNGTHAQRNSQIKILKRQLASKSLDLCILGLGRNGHLALNEPGSDIADTSRIVDLHPESRNHSMLSHSSITVKQGMTIGLQEISEAEELILLVSGQGKKEVFYQFLSKKRVEELPVSLLHGHPNSKCFVDRSSII